MASGKQTTPSSRANLFGIALTSGLLAFPLLWACSLFAPQKDRIFDSADTEFFITKQLTHLEEESTEEKKFQTLLRQNNKLTLKILWSVKNQQAEIEAIYSQFSDPLINGFWFNFFLFEFPKKLFQNKHAMYTRIPQKNLATGQAGRIFEHLLRKNPYWMEVHNSAKNETFWVWQDTPTTSQKRPDTKRNSNKNKTALRPSSSTGKKSRQLNREHFFRII